MTDVALERALDEAEDFPTRRDVGVQIARKALEEARQTGARVSGATLAEEYPQNKVRWWQDRLNTARAEIEAGIDTKTAEQNPDRHADRVVGTALVPTSVPIGTDSQEVGMPTQTKRAESARASVPTGDVGMEIGTESVPIPEVGTPSMPSGVPIAESAHRSVPISTDPSEIGTDQHANSWYDDLMTASADESARTLSTTPIRSSLPGQTGLDTPHWPDQPLNAAESPADATTAAATHLDVPQGPRELLDLFEGTSQAPAPTAHATGAGTEVGMPMSSERAESAHSFVPTVLTPGVGTAFVPTSVPIGTDSQEVGMPTQTKRAESARSSVPTSNVGMPTQTKRAESARSSVPTSNVGMPIGTKAVPTPEIGTQTDARRAESARDLVPTTGQTEPTQAAPPLIAPTETTGADKVAYAFYGVAATAALVGQVWAAVNHIPWPQTGFSTFGKIALVAPAVAVIELGGVATSALADVRRRRGENAYGYRTMSLFAALVALIFNVWGHWAPDERFLAFGFGGLSAFAYVLWLIHSSARRRDSLRGTGKLAETAPVYGPGQWLREPRLTKRARDLAVEHGYGVHESLRVAREEERTNTRRKAIAAAIERRIRELHKDDEVGATIAATTYDLDRLADEVKDRLDYATAADFIATDLVLELRSSEQVSR
ncbi:hypothetical protein ACFCV3_41735 [Kribbella sp. NPDC056345]|uniref:hypothetical protein n=1 Tax=Kribbella sp. NPDC056345 TaxID=3345789 RepID=UPI0035DB6D66